MLFVAAVYFIGQWAFESGRVPATVDENFKAVDPMNQPPPPRKPSPDAPKKAYPPTEERVANASPEFRKKYAEMVADAQAYAEEQARKRKLNPTPEDRETDALLKQVRQTLAEAEAETSQLSRERWYREQGLLAEGEAFSYEKVRDAIERQYEADLRNIEAAKRQSETHQENLEQFKRKLQQWGLWDYENNKPKTTR